MLEGYISRIIFRNEENGYTVFILEFKNNKSRNNKKSDDGENPEENGIPEKNEIPAKSEKQKNSKKSGDNEKLTADNVQKINEELIYYEDDVVCVGFFNAIEEGIYVKVDGHMEDNFRGPQFRVTSYEICVPKDSQAMERYLASGAIKGIGVSLAARIVSKFKEDTFRVIEEEPELLVKVRGISEKKAQEIGVQFHEKQEMRNAMMFMQKLGISNNTAIKLHKKYGERIYEVLRENPYQLADEVDGIGFRTADEIAAKAGVPVDSDYRIKSAILYVLNLNLGNGHSYLPMEQLSHELSQLLGIRDLNLSDYLSDLSIDRKIKVRTEGEKKNVYLLRLYYMELNCARMLWDLNVEFKVSSADIKRQLDKCCKDMEFELDVRQLEAVTESIRHGFFLLTGGPGTGKTTTINAILAYFDSKGMDVLLAAPTGRAARKMKETTGWEAQTVHRLLGVSAGKEEEGRENYMVFERNEDNPLETDVVIIDEASMVDIYLLNALLRAIVPGTRLIFVGDMNQLPSVGPGNVLRDIVDSGCFPMKRLEHIFRQAAKSDIIVNAHRINKGEYPVLDNKSLDFFMLERKKADEIIGVIIYLISKKLPDYVKAKPMEIQVLTPMRRGPLGVERLNPVLQRYLNPPEDSKAEKKYKDRVFRTGDKVMQIKNNYQLKWEIKDDYGVKRLEGSGVYNGDIGIIIEISDYLDVLVVEFEEGKRVIYHEAELEELELAYAITVHKSQGSEYPAVLIPLLSGSGMLLNRNLLYTAVTRARKCVTILGRKELVYQMVDNNQERKRYSALKERILEIRQKEMED